MAGYEDYISAMAQQSQENNVFNAKQAEINRQFQLEMSNTAHQREVRDLVAAGLNPILSVNAGASTGSGSMATADTSSAAGYAQLANTGMNNITQLAMAQIAASAQMQAAQISAQAVRDAAQLSYDAAIYGYDKGYEGKIDTSIVGTANKFINAAFGDLGVPDSMIGKSLLSPVLVAADLLGKDFKATSAKPNMQAKAKHR